MNFRSAVAAATLLALPMAAHAQPVNGLYMGLGVGPNFVQDQSVKSSAGKKLQSDVGVAAVGAVGYGYGNGLRTEMEFDYRYNNLRHDVGHEQKYGPMANVLYDFNMVPVVTPYVGVGVGYQAVSDSINGASAKGVFAYQAIAGAALPVAHNLSLTAEYRFLGTTGDRKYNGVKVDEDLNHAILFGVRYAFGAPASAPAPEPESAVVAPAPVSRSYMVFFDWDKAELTTRAKQIVAEAAANSTKVQTTKIEVNGYTDTSGTPKYNQGLSLRRAEAVAAELVRDGVAKNEIAIMGYGETHLLVPTGAGVREPQNRRVEIILK